MSVIEHDFAEVGIMLEELEILKKDIESGDVTGFSAVAIRRCGQATFYKSILWAQKTALIGAMETHKFGIMSELQAEKLAKELNL